MGSFTNFLELELLDHTFGNSAYSAPSTLYIGLSTTSIQDDGTGVTEPSGNGYSRVSKTNNSTNWPAATVSGGGRGLKSNGTSIDFPQATGSWGTVVDFFIADASSGGNILCYGTLTNSKTIDSGDTASFAANDLDIYLD